MDNLELRDRIVKAIHEGIDGGDPHEIAGRLTAVIKARTFPVRGYRVCGDRSRSGRFGCTLPYGHLRWHAAHDRDGYIFHSWAPLNAVPEMVRCGLCGEVWSKAHADQGHEHYPAPFGKDYETPNLMTREEGEERMRAAVEIPFHPFDDPRLDDPCVCGHTFGSHCTPEFPNGGYCAATDHLALGYGCNCQRFTPAQ